MSDGKFSVTVSCEERILPTAKPAKRLQEAMKETMPAVPLNAERPEDIAEYPASLLVTPRRNSRTMVNLLVDRAFKPRAKTRRILIALKMSMVLKKMSLNVLRVCLVTPRRNSRTMVNLLLDRAFEPRRKTRKISIALKMSMALKKISMVLKKMSLNVLRVCLVTPRRNSRTM